MFGISDLFKDKPVMVFNDYKKARPGTVKWMKIWKANPNLQEEMIEYQNKTYMWCNHRQQRIAAIVCNNTLALGKCRGCEEGKDMVKWKSSK